MEKAISAGVIPCLHECTFGGVNEAMLSMDHSYRLNTEQTSDFDLPVPAVTLLRHMVGFAQRNAK